MTRNETYEHLKSLFPKLRYDLFHNSRDVCIYSKEFPRDRIVVWPQDNQLYHLYWFENDTRYVYWDVTLDHVIRFISKKFIGLTIQESLF